MIHNTASSHLVFKVFKPTNMSSFDVVRYFKKNLPDGYNKIGHFGTLDPFACGLLLVGINGATKINNMIHDSFEKTYLAVGKLGVKTITGDLTTEPIEKDESAYLYQEIKNYPLHFLNDEFRKKFLGEYLQSPHVYSASKFEGRPLHEWAREGVLIQKKQVKRFIGEIQIIKFRFPWLSFRVTVSSGTFVRTLFEDMAKHLGTYGCLKALVRESIGPHHIRDSIKKINWPRKEERGIYNQGLRLDQVLPLKEIQIDEQTRKKYKNGLPFMYGKTNIPNQKVWVKYGEELVGMGEILNDHCQVYFNLN